jgi:hypothetical protein
MNLEDKAVLETILTHNPEDLTEYDVAFLNARRGYLNKEQLRVFDSVIVKEGAPVVVEEGNSVEPTPYVSKKDQAKIDAKAAAAAPPVNPTPETPAPVVDSFAGRNADPDAKVLPQDYNGDDMTAVDAKV